MLRQTVMCLLYVAEMDLQCVRIWSGTRWLLWGTRDRDECQRCPGWEARSLLARGIALAGHIKALMLYLLKSKRAISTTIFTMKFYVKFLFLFSRDRPSFTETSLTRMSRPPFQLGRQLEIHPLPTTVCVQF